MSPLTVAAPIYVTSLPSTPYDGQEVYYAADATNGIIWHLRYRAAASGSYKWEYVGGSPMRHTIDTAEAITAGTDGWIDAATVGPTLTIPLAGDYEYRARADSYGTMSAALALPIGISVGGAAPAAATWAYIEWNSGSTNSGATVLGVITGQAASTVFKLQYYRYNAQTYTVRWRTLMLTPVRVG